MARLPIPGGDDGNWGDILNAFLEIAHNSDGSLLGSSLVQAGGVTTVNGKTASGGGVNLGLADLTDVNGASSASNNQVLAFNSVSSKWVPSTVSSTTVSDATSSNKGIIQLAGDIAGGTAAAPQVTSTHLASALPLNQGGTGSTSQNFVDLSTGQSIGGVKTFTSAPVVPGSAFPESAITNLTTDLAGKVAKAGDTMTGKLVVPSFQVTGGSPASGQVLTADSSGNATWEAAAGAQALAATTVKTSAYGAAAGDFVPVDASGGSVTITLPAAPADKTRVGVKMVAVSSNNTTSIVTGGSDVFNKTAGSTSLSLTLLNQGMLLQYTASTGIWYVQSDDLALSQLDGRYSGNLAIDVSRTPYNVLPSNTPGGEVGIQAAIDQANTNATAGSGPTEVFVPPGTYVVDIHSVPGSSSVAAAIWMRSNVTLKFAPGAILQLKPNVALPGSTTQGHIVSVVTPYSSSGLSAVKYNITLDGLIVDGNGNNQVLQGNGAPMIAHGIFLGLVQGGWVTRCKVQGLNGTGGSPPNETMHFECNHSVGVRYVACEVDGSTATDTASGFSIDNSFDISYALCTAHDLSHGQGFTCWQSSGIRYSTCQSYNNVAGSGFNNERSTDVTYAGCVAGGSSPFIESPSAALPQFPSGQVTLGNKAGWTVSGGTDIILSGCQATNNSFYGIHFYTSTDGPNPPTDNIVCTRCYAIGGSFFNNTVSNITMDTGQVDTYALWVKISSNTDYISVQGNAPNLHFPTGTSGKRETVSGYSSWAYRWVLASSSIGVTPTGRLTGSAEVGIDFNGVLNTSGYAANRRAVTTSTSVAASDEIIAVGSLSAGITVTLPSTANVATGARFIIKDEGGGAATNNITIATTSGQTIDGASTQVINTNYGVAVLYSDGTNWKLSVVSNGSGNMSAATYDPAGINQQVVGTTATQTVSGKRISRRVGSVTQSATPAINTDTMDVASITGLAQTITSMTTSLTGTPNDGDLLMVRLTDNGTGRAINWGASFEASGNVALPTGTTASTMLMVGFAWNTVTSKWRCIAVA